MADGVAGQNGGASKRSPSPKPAESTTASASPKPKRRKVNHACIYCRRSHMTCESERPCTRCVKRGIGHLCHDEPREAGRKSKGDHSNTTNVEDDATIKADEMPTVSLPLDLQQNQRIAVTTANLNSLAQASNYVDWRLPGQNQFHDMHNIHPSYMFNAPEVTNEYNLLNNFLNTSLIDEAAMFAGDNDQALYSDSVPLDTLTTKTLAGPSFATPILPAQQQSLAPPPAQDDRHRRKSSVPPSDKDQAAYYLTAADPSGSDNPDARIQKLLQAKYDAGMLRPFNYVKGYARLNQYMEKHMQPASRQKILRQLDKFRPKFRERMQSLTDVELVFVEMWFERCLMEYDRVFASMAVPACCWRRTGEIFRGNKEMAELIHVPIEKLKDGKLAIHEIIVEDHLVSYWEKFGAIAFDKTQKAMLTSCSLRNPDLRSTDPDIPCCFSFTIRRDEHDIQSFPDRWQFPAYECAKKAVNERSGWHGCGVYDLKS